MFSVYRDEFKHEIGDAKRRTFLRDDETFFNNSNFPLETSSMTYADFVDHLFIIGFTPFYRSITQKGNSAYEYIFFHREGIVLIVTFIKNGNSEPALTNARMLISYVPHDGEMALMEAAAWVKMVLYKASAIPYVHADRNSFVNMAFTHSVEKPLGEVLEKLEDYGVFCHYWNNDIILERSELIELFNGYTFAERKELLRERFPQPVLNMIGYS